MPEVLGCGTELKGCGGCAVVAKWGCRFSGPTPYFAASMPSCGCCDCDKYDNNSKARGVGVLCQKHLDVAPSSRGVEGVQYWQSGGADFLAPPPTLQQVCRPVAAVTVINTTIIARQGVWECCARSTWMWDRAQGVWRVCITGKVGVQIFWPHHLLCSKYAVLWLL